MHSSGSETAGWATWQLLCVELEADAINVDAVELPGDATQPLSLLTLTFDRRVVGGDHEALLAMLRRWATGTTLCHVVRADRPDGGLALFQGAESLVVTSTPL